MNRISGLIVDDVRGLALVACRNVIVDPASGMQTVVGTFDMIDSQSFPFIFSLSVYVSIGGTPAAPCAFHLMISAPDGKVLAQGAVRCDHLGEANAAQFGLEFPDVQFKAPGAYCLRLAVGDRVLIERTLVVKAVSSHVDC